MPSNAAEIQSAAQAEAECNERCYKDELHINENKMSDGGPRRALFEVEVWKSSQSGAYGGPPFAPSHGFFSSLLSRQNIVSAFFSKSSISSRRGVSTSTRLMWSSASSTHCTTIF